MTISANYPSIRPSLLLDFANSKQLDPRITFSRPTTGTYYDGKTVAKAEENLFLQSQTFNVNWTNSNITVSPTGTTAPDGTATGNVITETTAAGIHRFNQTVSTLASTSYVLSMYLKYVDCQYVSLITSPTAGSATFDLVNGTVFTSSGTLSNFIASVGNGWYRVGFVLNNFTAGNTQFFIQMMDAAGTSNNYTGTSRVVYAWGAQLEQRSSVTAYTPTTTAPITNYIPTLLTAASGVARFEHNPVTGESLGLEIEEQRTNLLTYSEDYSNAVWLKTRCSITPNTIVAPDGTLTGDKFFVDTTNANTHRLNYNFTYSAGSYTTSIYAKAGEYPFLIIQTDNNTSKLAWFNLSTGTLGTVNAGLTATISAVGNGWYRCSITYTAIAAGSSIVLYPAETDGNTVIAVGNGFSGLYIWGASLEAGAFATSYIPTVASQVTRSADSASMTGTNFSSWYRADEGTVYNEGTPSVLGAYRISSISDGTTSNRILLSTAVAGNNSVVISSGTSVVDMVSGTTTVNVSQKQAFAYKVNDFAISGNGFTATTDAVGVLPIVNQLQIGAGQGGTAQLNGTIKKLAYYPIRVTNAQLQALTGS